MKQIAYQSPIIIQWNCPHLPSINKCTANVFHCKKFWMSWRKHPSIHQLAVTVMWPFFRYTCVTNGTFKHLNLNKSDQINNWVTDCWEVAVRALSSRLRPARRSNSCWKVIYILLCFSQMALRTITVDVYLHLNSLCIKTCRFFEIPQHHWKAFDFWTCLV